MSNTFLIVLNVLDLVVLGLLAVEFLYVAIISLLVILYHKHPFNVLWSSRLTICASVIIWMVGLICGCVQYLWNLADIVPIMCRIYPGLVFGSGHVGATCTFLFVLLQQVTINRKTSNCLDDNDENSTTNRLSFSSRMKCPSLLANLHIAWKTLLVFVIVFLLHLAVILVDVFVGNNKKLPEIIFNNYMKQGNTCRLPILAFVVYAIYVIVFISLYIITSTRMMQIFINRKLRKRFIQSLVLISVFMCISLICRVVELVASIVPWPDVNHLFRLISAVADIITSAFIITYFVGIPTIDIIRVIRWQKAMKDMDDPASQIGTSSQNNTVELHRSSKDRLLPKRNPLSNEASSQENVYNITSEQAVDVDRDVKLIL